MYRELNNTRSWIEDKSLADVKNSMSELFDLDAMFMLPKNRHRCHDPQKSGGGDIASKTPLF